MRKIFTLLCVLSTLALSAQNVQRRIALESGERIMGYYDTDDLPTSLEEYQAYLGMTDVAMDLKAGSCFETQVTEKFVGGEITKIRFAIADSTCVVSNVFVCEMDPNYNFSSYTDYLVTEQDISDQKIVTGWNDVTLNEPVEIKEDKYYMIGFQYTQTDTNYPLVTDYELDTDYSSTYGFFLYGAITSYYGTDWYYFNTYGQLCIQAVVKGGQFIDNDLLLKKLTASSYVSLGGELSYSFQAKNYGNLDVESYKIAISINGEVVETLDTPVALTSSAATIAGTIPVSTDLVSGKSYTLKIEVVEINGETPTANTDDDVLTATFTAYEGSVERQMHLVEQFTSIYCGYCPRGHDVIESLQELYPNKYAWVAMHGSGMGSDPYIMDGEPSYYAEYFSGLYQSYPTGMFDRLILDDSTLNSAGTLGISLGWASTYKKAVAQLINETIDAAYESIPAFVSVDIDAQYDMDTRELVVAVYGEGVDVAKSVLSDAVLTVYLTEDGIEGTQEDYDNGQSSKSYFIDYTHDNVCRAILSYPYGDDIDWESKSSYYNEYTITLDSDWVAGNMKVVAFISGPMVQWISGSGYWAEEADAYVNNANEFSLQNATGIKSVRNTTELNDGIRYNLSGQKVNENYKGIVIQNGKKRLVK